MENLELRMYGLVPYNISPIQQAIQMGHGVVEYQLQHAQSISEVNGLNESGRIYRQYYNWANNWKTFIILNGGTTSDKLVPTILEGTIEGHIPHGSLNNHVLFLEDIKYPHSIFREPDLGDQLTSINFIADERVFNKIKYLDWKPWVKQNLWDTDVELQKRQKYNFNKWFKESENSFVFINEIVPEWIEYLGGMKNAKIREFLQKFRLA